MVKMIAWAVILSVRFAGWHRPSRVAWSANATTLPDLRPVCRDPLAVGCGVRAAG